MRWLSLALLAAAVPFSASAVEGDFQWKGALRAGQSLEIKGINGPIRAELAAGTQVEVRAIKKARRSNPASVRIDAIPHSGGITFCAVYPDDGRRPNECKPGDGGHMSTRNNDVNVEFTVKVPAGVQLIAKTVNGGIEVVGLRSEVVAHTTNGKIVVATSETAEAHTVNGSISASLGSGGGSAPLRFTTTNGSIEVQLPPATNADVRASTVNGNISSDFPLTVSGKFGPKSIHGRIGNGGRQLELTTVNGRITLRRG